MIRETNFTRYSMNNKIVPVAEIAKLNTKLFLNCLEDVGEPVAQKRPNEKTNNIIFIACHLLDARYYLANFMGLNLENPFKEIFEGPRSIDEMKEYPDFEQIKSEWQRVSTEINQKMGSLDSTILNEKSKDKFPIDDESVLGAISFLVGHEAYHIGQLSILRKFFGLEAMKY